MMMILMVMLGDDCDVGDYFCDDDCDSDYFGHSCDNSGCTKIILMFMVMNIIEMVMFFMMLVIIYK